MTTTRYRLLSLVCSLAIATITSGFSYAEERDLVVEVLTKPARAANVSLMPTSPAVVAIGDPFGLRLGSAADGFGHLYALSASGKVQLWLENVPLRANRRISYPSNGLGLRAAPPAGDDTIIFLFTRERLDGFAGYGTSRLPQALQMTSAAFNVALDQKKAAMRPGRWASVSTIVRVRDN